MSDEQMDAVDGADEADAIKSIEPVLAEVAKPVGDAANVVRVEHDLRVTWSGVQGCCSDNRPQREVTSDFNQWVGAQIAARPNMVHLRSGHGGGEARCRSSNSGWPNNERSCGGSVTVKAFIEFEPR